MTVQSQPAPNQTTQDQTTQNQTRQNSRTAIALFLVLVFFGGVVALSSCASQPTVSAGVTGPTGSSMAADGRTLTPADGFSPDGSSFSPFAETPAMGNLKPGLRDAVRSAAVDARSAGVEMVVNTGWRSERYQRKLLDDAIVSYGSETEALRWVSSPTESMHVKGSAVDIGPTDADSWLSQHGSDYGLCQTLANEIWHYELATSPGGACPEQRSDAAAG